MPDLDDFNPFEPEEEERAEENLEAWVDTNYSTESLVLGVILCNRELISPANNLAEIDFQEEIHRRFWGAILRLNETGIDLDPVSVINELNERNLLRPGEDEYLFNLADLGIARASNLTPWVKKLLKQSQRHKIRRVFDGGLMDLERGKKDPEEIIKTAESLLTASDPMKLTVVRKSKDLADIIITNLDKIHQETGFGGINLGLSRLDKITGGLNRKDLTILAARPSMGKSAMIFQSAFNAAKDGVPVLVISLEMSEESSGWRILSNQANIDLQRLRKSPWKTREQKDSELRSAVTAVNHIDGLPFSLMTTTQKTPANIFHHIRKWADNNLGGLVMIDHLQYISLPKLENRTHELGELARNFKTLSEELEIAILLACQLSRGVEARDNKRPMLSDLRDSGEIEEAADLVLSLYRPKYYYKASEELDEISILKHRNGMLGTAFCKFVPEFCRFDDVSDHEVKINKERTMENENKRTPYRTSGR